MSTVEKAFLKSLENKDSPESLASDTDDLQNLHQKRDASQLTSSKRSISNMKQSAIYTANDLDNRRLIHSNMKDKKLLNHYRNLRTRLLSKSSKENFVTLVTSVVPDKDTSLISANLAAAIALDESKTAMLVEANISNPILNEIFNMKSRPGLVDFLEEDNTESETYLQKTGVPRLRMVPSGQPKENATEYFTSDKMREFINELVSRYPDRFPIINAPSITNSADARILLDLCDQAILVVPYGKCSEEEILNAAITIGNEKLSGLVLNNF